MRRISSPWRAPRPRARSSSTRRSSSATSIRSTPISRLKSEAAAGNYPKPPDNFRWRFHGLFYVAPNQNSFMCRLRMPNGILNHWQMAGLALLAETHGGGYAACHDPRQSADPRDSRGDARPRLIEAIQDLGLATRGSGADNIRNVTGTPTAGIDPQELIDTRPYARAWHFHVLNTRTLHGLPRKFNVAFDGGGAIAALEDTNDIGFSAVEVVDGARGGAGHLVPADAGRHHRAQGFRPADRAST